MSSWTAWNFLYQNDFQLITVEKTVDIADNFVKLARKNEAVKMSTDD